jgi:hypothetical protein
MSKAPVCQLSGCRYATTGELLCPKKTAKKASDNVQAEGFINTDPSQALNEIGKWFDIITGSLQNPTRPLGAPCNNNDICDKGLTCRRGKCQEPLNIQKVWEDTRNKIMPYL